MKLKDMRIRTQLRLGMGLILAFVILLGAVAWIQTDLLWSQTESLYTHPLQVSRAVGQLKADIQGMRRAMRDLLLAENDPEITAALRDVETGKADAFRQFEIIYDRYLGPRTEITSLENDFVGWNVYHDETIRLVRAGRKAEALARTRTGSVDGGPSDALISHVREIDTFARLKADEFFQAATVRNDTLKRQLAGIVMLILLLTFAISWFLIQGIKEPLANLTRAAERFRLGHLESRSGYLSKNEFGVLSATFNEMAEAVETQMFINERAARLAGVMLRETEARSFCLEMIRELVEQTGSQSGAVYLLNAPKTLFEHFESIGLAGGGRASFAARELEGEFGAALATGKMQRITNIPDDTRFALATVGGDYVPREIITLPLLDGQEVVAMVSLAGIHGYDEKSIRLLEVIESTVTARMNGVLAFRQVQELAERLDHHNRELQAQKQELIAQTGELTHQNTELAMQKQQLDAANRLKSTFLSNMSHELRTPLNSVIALSSVLGRRLANKIPEEEFDYLEVIERNGRHLLALINDILDLSRIESGRMEISPARFSLRTLVSEVVEMLAPLAREKGIALRNQVDGDLPQLVTDPDKFRHIVQNLISNAVKFTETGSVEVSARSAGEEICLAVRDTGIGIAAEHLPLIFEEFRQADEGTARRYGGTGLGLAIAKKYALLLQGDIKVESTVGQGSVFTLRLPCRISPSAGGGEAARGPEAKAIVAGSGAISGGGRCVLLVEDSEPAMIQMTDILSEQGYRVQTARNGSDALALINGSLPDAVILDLMMPGMDGFQVLRQIRSAERTAPLPVLILTAKHVTKEELSFLTGNNIHQLIQKGGIGKDQLLTAVAGMVAKPPEAPVALRRSKVKTAPRVPPVVLVVEDNPDNLKTARALLADSCRVIAAADGQEAVAQARRHQPDLVLMDLALPFMDGFAALTAIREDKALRHIPVVAVTASAMVGDREAILAQGFDGYISKPIDEKVLLQTLAEVFNGNE